VYPNVDQLTDHLRAIQRAGCFVSSPSIHLSVIHVSVHLSVVHLWVTRFPEGSDFPEKVFDYLIFLSGYRGKLWVMRLGMPDKWQFFGLHKNHVHIAVWYKQ
jgi:hypothetical protein